MTAYDSPSHLSIASRILCLSLVNEFRLQRVHPHETRPTRAKHVRSEILPTTNLFLHLRPSARHS